MFNSHMDIISPGELLKPLKVGEVLKCFGSAKTGAYCLNGTVNMDEGEENE